MAAGLFLQLTAFCEAARQRGQQVPEYDVGVVTPYRQQKACLRETFERMAGPAASSKVPSVTPAPPYKGCVSSSKQTTGLHELLSLRCSCRNNTIAHAGYITCSSG